jgi:transcriptional regulator with XRE-family HTH domain
MNLSDIAEGSDLTLSYISLVFSGKRVPSLVCAARIARTMGISLDDFYAYLEDAFGPLPSRAKVQYNK